MTVTFYPKAGREMLVEQITMFSVSPGADGLVMVMDCQ
jgi:hypothetical protein